MRHILLGGGGKQIMRSDGLGIGTVAQPKCGCCDQVCPTFREPFDANWGDRWAETAGTWTVDEANKLVECQGAGQADYSPDKQLWEGINFGGDVVRDPDTDSPTNIAIEMVIGGARIRREVFESSNPDTAATEELTLDGSVLETSGGETLTNPDAQKHRRFASSLGICVEPSYIDRHPIWQGNDTTLLITQGHRHDVSDFSTTRMSYINGDGGTQGVKWNSWWYRHIYDLSTPRTPCTNCGARDCAPFVCDDGFAPWTDLWVNIGGFSGNDLFGNSCASKNDQYRLPMDSCWSGPQYGGGLGGAYRAGVTLSSPDYDADISYRIFLQNLAGSPWPIAAQADGTLPRPFDCENINFDAPWTSFAPDGCVHDGSLVEVRMPTPAMAASVGAMAAPVLQGTPGETRRGKPVVPLGKKQRPPRRPGGG